MIFQADLLNQPLSQGVILDECPLLIWEEADHGLETVELRTRVIVLTQACDLAQTKTTRVVVAVVHQAQELVDRSLLTPSQIRDQIRAHRFYGWHFLPASGELSESLVDLRDLHTVPRKLLEQLIVDGKRICRLVTPYREHMAQQFATTYARIALPEPYDTE